MERHGVAGAAARRFHRNSNADNAIGLRKEARNPMKRISSAAGLVAALLWTSACPVAAMDVAPGAGVAAKNEVKPQAAKPVPADQAVKAKPAVAKKKPVSSTVLAGKAAASANAVGQAVFAELADATPADNVVVSPYNIALALNILAQGASDKTAVVFDKGLHLSDQHLSLTDAEAAMNALRTSLPSGAGVTVEVANGLWSGKSYPVKPGFAARALKYYAARIDSVDFADPQTRVAINKWVEDETHGKSPQILAQLPATTQLVIAGALYVKGTWADKFDVAATVPADFACGNGAKVSVPTMHRSATYSYFETDAFQALSLPFSDQHYELVVVLPKPGKEADIRAGLGEGLSALDSVRFVSRPGKLALPRLKLSWSGDLLETLKSVGLRAALSEGAVYDRLASKPLTVGAVAHKTTFELDENGAEAAAATAIVGVRAAMIEPPFVMTLDRPFYFVLREKVSGVVLFAGFVSDPGTEKAN
jgi:serine protease inhibitor